MPTRQNITSEPATTTDPVAAGQAPEGAIFNPRTLVATCTWAST